MIIKNLKAELSEEAQAKLKEYIGKAVEYKVQAEMKKVAKKLTKKLIIGGVAVCAVLAVAGNADKIAARLMQPKQ